MSVIIPNADFDFSKINLGNPSGIQGGAYFSKITFNGDQFLIQTPKSSTKSGITTTDKKNCVDFMFNIEQTVFSNWIEQFERRIKELIYQRKDAWFTSEMTMEDVDYFFTPISRVYKAKNYLVRAFEQRNKMFKSEKKYNFGIFGENGEEANGDDLANEETKCISILEIQGLKFTSNSFRVEIAISQIMIVKEKKLTEYCIIKKLDEKQPEDVEEKRPVVEEKRPVVEEKRPVVEEKRPVVEEKRPVVEEKRPVVENVVEEKRKSDVSKIKAEQHPPKIVVPVDDIQEVNLSLENIEEIQEINILPSAISCDDEPISLKQPNEVYYEIYKEARKKAKIAKNVAIKAYLEAKQIKNTYLLDDFDSEISSEDEEDNIFEAI
jgi:hypothetical protein